MLNSNLERKSFLLSSKNWILVFKKEELGLTISKICISDGIIIYKIIFKYTYINQDNLKGKFEDVNYRVKINDSISENLSMTYLIDLLRKL